MHNNIVKFNNFYQIHGNVEISYEKQFDYLKKIEKYSDYLKYPIVFTLHSIYDENMNLIAELNYDPSYRCTSGNCPDEKLKCDKNDSACAQKITGTKCWYYQ